MAEGLGALCPSFFVLICQRPIIRGTPMLKSMWAAAAVVVLFAASAAASVSVTLSTTAGHPSLDIKVSGGGFAPNEAVDVYFDTTDMFLGFTDDSGNLSAHDMTIPASALPGPHWVTAIGRKNGDGNQTAFTVRTDWTESGFTERRRRFNPYENVLNTGNVSSLDMAWTFKTGDVINSSPAIASGGLFVGSYDHKIYALNPATGAVFWSMTTGGNVYSSPAVSKGIVYAARATESSMR